MFDNAFARGLLRSVMVIVALSTSASAQIKPPIAPNPIEVDHYVHLPAFTVSNQNSTIHLFSLEAYRCEFLYLNDQLRRIDLKGRPVSTDGWTHNIAEAEWPFLSFAYLGYAAANLAVYDPVMIDMYRGEMRWLIDALQTPRMSGFVTPHFGEPFGPDMHVAVFVHGHFLNLALRYREIFGDKQYDPLIHQIAAALVKSYSGTNGPVLPSYRDMWWLTDNFPAMSALARYDRIFGRDTSAARTLFLTALKRYYLDKSTGLSDTYINAQSHVPLQGSRGISVMYGLHFLKDFDPSFANVQYQLATHCFVKTLFGVAAVREFPEGVEPAQDIDSGPLVFGFGPSASGFAIAAAAVNGDTNTAWNLLEATALIGLPELRNEGLHYDAMPTVGQTVILFGKSELLKSEIPPHQRP